MKKDRILFLDGLKGFACLGVFTHHFFLTFFPASYFGEDAAVMTASGFDARLASAPYAFFVNGNFWVCLFILISSFLISSKVFRLKEESGAQAFPALSKLLLKRYVRLLMPVLTIGVFNYVLVVLLTFTNLNYMDVVNRLSFRELLYHAVIYMWITPDSAVQGPFWMLHYLLFGSYLAVLITLATPKASRWTPLIHLFLAVSMGVYNRYYAAAVFGVMICYEYSYGKLLSFLRRSAALRVISGGVLMFTGLFLGSYPSYGLPDNIYSIFRFYAVRDQDAGILIHCIGAACLLLSFFLLHEAARIFSTAPFLFVGKISFSIYLTHTMLLTYLGYFVMHRLNEQTGNYSLSGGIAYLFLTVLLFLLSLLCLHTVEKFGNWACERLFEDNK